MSDWVEEYEESICWKEAVGMFFNDLQSYNAELYAMLQEAKERGSLPVDISENQLPLVRDFFKAYPLHREFRGYFKFRETHPVAISRLEELESWRRLVCGLIFKVGQYPDLVEKLLQDDFNDLTERDLVLIKSVCDEYPHIKKRFDKTLGRIIE